MLGELYIPKGKAFETAQQVLEISEPWACNVAYGCTNCCEYCYVPYIKKGEVRFPKKFPVELVKAQLEKGLKFEVNKDLKPVGVFLSFTTDPFLKELHNATMDLIELLIDKGIGVATLSKMGFSFLYRASWLIRTGMTIVSPSDDFSKKFEPRALPISGRIKLLEMIKQKNGYTWVSLEPYPTPEIWEQDLIKLLDRISFVDFIIFGKWNYDIRANDIEFYKKTVNEFKTYCKKHSIRYAVKSDTLRFIGETI